MDLWLERVAIVGTSCAGKTTLARTLAGSLRTAHIELDALHWGPNWTPTPPELLRPRVEAAVAGSRWVCDGNYGSVRHSVWSRATAIVWLNYPFPLVMMRALRRTIGRTMKTERLWSDNRETFGRSFLSRDSILWWVITTHRRRQRMYRALFARPEYPHLRLVELRSVRETRDFVERVARSPIVGVA